MGREGWRGIEMEMGTGMGCGELEGCEGVLSVCSCMYVFL